MTTSPLLQDAVTSMPGADAAGVVWRQSGRLHVTVIVKATFAFAPGAAMEPAEPQRIVRAEVHHGRNPSRSVRLTTDLAPFLHRADVLFTGHAHALPGSTVHELAVRLALFDNDRPLLDKALRVCSREPFQRMPIVYERAFGGLGFAENPLGVGAGASTETPTVVDPAGATRVAGFGPLGRALPTRKQLLGGTRRQVLEGDIAEIPDVFDWTYFHAAPMDQRIEYLRGDEWIVLEGLHPAEPRLRMQLPHARAVARLDGVSAFRPEGNDLVLVADTLRIDGEEQRCTVVWRGHFPVPDEAALRAVRVVAGVELAGRSGAWSATGPAAPALGAVEDGVTRMVAIADRAKAAPAMPFRAASSPSPLAQPAAREAPDHVESGTLALSDEPERWRSALPFGGRPAVAPEAAPVPPPLWGSSPAAMPDPAAAPRPEPALPAASTSATAPAAPPAARPALPAAPPPPRPPLPTAAAPAPPPPRKLARPASKVAAGPPALSAQLRGGLYGKFGK